MWMPSIRTSLSHAAPRLLRLTSRQSGALPAISLSYYAFCSTPTSLWHGLFMRSAFLAYTSFLEEWPAYDHKRIKCSCCCCCLVLSRVWYTGPYRWRPPNHRPWDSDKTTLVVAISISLHHSWVHQATTNDLWLTVTHCITIVILHSLLRRRTKLNDSENTRPAAASKRCVAFIARTECHDQEIKKYLITSEVWSWNPKLNKQNIRVWKYTVI